MKGATQRLSRRQLWLAVAALVLYVPWLALACGRCPLRAAQTGSGAAGHPPVVADCCPDCPSSACGAQWPAIPAAPTQTAFCCETVKAFLPLTVELTKPKWREARELPERAAVVLAPAVFNFGDASFVGPCAEIARGRTVRSSDAFLHTVVRRCFPSHAPPALTQLS